MSPFEFLRPARLDEAVASLRAGGAEAVALAGGMTLIPTMKHALANPVRLVDLSAITELRGVSLHAGELVIAAMSTHAQVANDPLVRSNLTALASLAAGIGDTEVRHRGTIGGSLATNDPSADYPAACLALQATLTTDRRSIPADRYFQGLFRTALSPGEIITAVRFKPPRHAAYIKFPNQASRYATVGVFVAQWPHTVRVAVTGASREGVLRLPGVEQALMHTFSVEALPPHGIAQDTIMDDIHARARYRSHLVDVGLRRAVAACLGIEPQGPRRHGGAHSL